MKHIKISAVVFMLFVAGIMFGCGGGGSSSNTPAPVTVNSLKVTGVAATGTPITGTVYLKDSENPAKELSSVINSDGSFSFDVTGMTAPYILKAVGTANGKNYTLYSFAGSAGTANINPLSHLAVVQANGGVDPGSLYATPSAARMEAVKSLMTTGIAQIQTLLRPLLSDYNATTTNFVSDSYVANHTGLDLLFDLVAIDVANGSLVVTNKTSGAAIMTTTVNGSTLSGNVNTSNFPVIPPAESLFGKYNLSAFEVVYPTGQRITSSTPGITFSGTFTLNSNNTGNQSIMINGTPISINATWSYNAATAKMTFVTTAGVTSVAAISFSDNVLTTVTVNSAGMTEYDHWTKISNHAAKALSASIENEVLPTKASVGALIGTSIGGM